MYITDKGDRPDRATRPLSVEGSITIHGDDGRSLTITPGSVIGDVVPDQGLTDRVGALEETVQRIEEGCGGRVEDIPPSTMSYTLTEGADRNGRPVLSVVPGEGLSDTVPPRGAYAGTTTKGSLEGTVLPTPSSVGGEEPPLQNPPEATLLAIRDGADGFTGMAKGSWTEGGAGMDLLKDLYVCMVDDSGNTVRRLDMWDLSKDESGKDVPFGDYRRYQIMLAIPFRHVDRTGGKVTFSADGPGDAKAHTLGIGGVDEEFDELLIGMYSTGAQIGDDGSPTGRIGSYTSPPVDGWDGFIGEYREKPPGEPSAPGDTVYRGTVYARTDRGRIKVRPLCGEDGAPSRLSREGFRRKYMERNTCLVNGFHYADPEGKAVWMQTNWFQYSLIRDIAVAVMQSPLSQETFGFGYDKPTDWAKTSGDRAPAGMCDRIGPFLGHAGWDNGVRPWKVPVKLLVENLWGSIWQYLDDMCIDPSDHVMGVAPAGTVDTIPVWAGHSHPDTITSDGSHDRLWNGTTYPDLVPSDTRIPTVPESGIPDWSSASVASLGDSPGPAAKVTDGTKALPAWSTLTSDVAKGHIGREKIGDIRVEWTGNSFVKSSTYYSPYNASTDKCPTGVHLDGDGYGLPKDIRGGNYTVTGYGLKDTLYTSPAKRGVAMWGGRSGHGAGSGLFSLSFAPDIQNTDVNHGSRIALLRRRTPAVQKVRTVTATASGGKATAPCNGSAVVGVELDGSSVHTVYDLGGGSVTVYGLKGYDGHEVKVRYI